VNRIPNSRRAALLTAFALIVVIATGLPAQAQNGNLTIANVLPDEHALLPVNNWAPLFSIEMAWSSEDDPLGARYLTSLDYTVTGGRWDSPRSFSTWSGPGIDHLYEFGLFRDGQAEGDGAGELSTGDTLLYVWSADGPPMATAAERPGRIEYSVDFVGGGAPDAPEFPVPNSPAGTLYFIGVRTSALWQNGMTLGYVVNNAQMFPAGPDDSYSPDFPAGETFVETIGYSASFSAYDITGGLSESFQNIETNAWNQPHKLYTPQPEFSRPRWDVSASAADFVAGEYFQLRKLFSIEDWTAVIGLNLHATNAAVSEYWERTDFDPVLNPTPRGDVGGVMVQSLDAPYPLEINVVMVDIGGDPLGPPGNGGFNPSEGLEFMRYQLGTAFDGAYAVNRDHTFNGVWLFQDSNGNNVFDPPTSAGGSGVNLNDRPAMPVNSGVPGDPQRFYPMSYGSPLYWEYIPNPPDGGDPWWRIKLAFGPSRDSTSDGNNIRMQPVPDGDVNTMPTVYYHDYFIAIRPDSGYTDSSTVPGDGTGYTLGADTRVLIEPRYPASVRHPDADISGGMLIGSQFPYEWGRDWQLHPGWNPGGAFEGWWPNRTQNQHNTKRIKGGFEVRDYVLTYDSDSDWNTTTDIFYLGRENHGRATGDLTGFDMWMDPWGELASLYQEFHSVGVSPWQPVSAGVQDRIQVQQAFESAPFFSVYDSPPIGPRSQFYPNPTAQPSRPGYLTWPLGAGLFSDNMVERKQLALGQYPRLRDWYDYGKADQVRARILKQHIEPGSIPTPMLGINMASVTDPATRQHVDLQMQRMTVAFWGPDMDGDGVPDFSPDDLLALAQGGVALWADNKLGGSPGIFGSDDSPMDLKGLAWADAPEYVDIDGDKLPDDINGDGVIDELDKCWALRLTPSALWTLPTHDQFGALRGDDLFVVVQTANQIARFTRFKAFVPAWLPERAPTSRPAGIELTPQSVPALTGYEKTHPEEVAGQGFYEHELLEANVAVSVVDMTSQGTPIFSNGKPAPVLGLDASTNRGEMALVDFGEDGVPGDGTFAVADAAWPAGALVDFFLIDSGYESYQITGNTATTLTLLSGTPQPGPWRIIKDPTFLEQVMVEFYLEPGSASLNLLDDLAPFDVDPEKSGVALYRDNDNHPDNTNGAFDPGIDVPVQMDIKPYTVGQLGEPEYQVMMVFSSPGTDDWPVPLADQARNRQIVPESFGEGANDPDAGPDFFVIMRASGDTAVGSTFRAAIVGWGPNTPTEPDPDTFPAPPEAQIGEFDIFAEFPWGTRPLGFITFFGDYSAYDQDADLTYYNSLRRNWIRSTTMVRAQTAPVSIVPSYTLIIESPEGRGSTNPEPGEYDYGVGEVATIFATAEPGWEFESWVGDVVGSDNPLTLVMNSDRTLHARFVAQRPTLDMRVIGSGSTEPAGVTDHALDSVVAIRALPQPGWTFVQWQGDHTGNKNPDSIVMDRDKVVYAVFETQSYTLRMNVDGQGSTTPGVGVHSYAAGSSVTLRATAAPGWTFVHWEGSVSGSQNPTSVVMNGDREVTAVFAEGSGAIYTLTTAVQGQGSTNPPKGVREYPAGSEVTITASPDPGWRFLRWGGDLSGNISPATVTMDQNRTVIAIFEQEAGEGGGDGDGGGGDGDGGDGGGDGDPCGPMQCCPPTLTGDMRGTGDPYALGALLLAAWLAAKGAGRFYGMRARRDSRS